ncbi:hypothetical protein [Nostoc sp.]|uniref:hypothetical protein n=1 Tax=Nostoc sp. TaxID=1180 RepID=UPI002FFB2E94
MDFGLSCGTLRVACFCVRGASRREGVRRERSVERFGILDCATKSPGAIAIHNHPLLYQNLVVFGDDSDCQ